jgi:predicted  nucleic acid-binding Zn-ribbon protein
MAEDETTLQSIHRVMTEISETRGQVKTVRDHANDVLEQNDEYRALKDELQVLTEKRKQLKKLMQDDKDYQNLASELEELRFKLKDLQEIMSHHLVTYYNETQNTEITDNNGETHTITLSAKIGRV